VNLGLENQLAASTREGEIIRQGIKIRKNTGSKCPRTMDLLRHVHFNSAY